MTTTPPDSTAVEQWMKSIGYEIARGGWQKLHSSGRKFEYLSDEQAAFFYQVCRAGETRGRIDELKIVQRYTDEMMDEPLIYYVRNRLQQLKAGEQAHE